MNREEELLREAFELSCQYRDESDPTYGSSPFSIDLENMDLDSEVLVSALAGFGARYAEADLHFHNEKNNLEELYGQLYVEVTDNIIAKAIADRGPKATASSKYDNDYRRGVVAQKPEYKKKLVEVTRLEYERNLLKNLYEALRAKQYLMGRTKNAREE